MTKRQKGEAVDAESAQDATTPADVDTPTETQAPVDASQALQNAEKAAADPTQVPMTVQAFLQRYPQSAAIRAVLPIQHAGEQHVPSKWQALAAAAMTREVKK